MSPFGGKGDWLRHFHDCIGLRNVPAIGPLARRRSIVRIACWSFCFGPRVENFDFLAGKRRVVRKMPDGAIGKPRRHFPACGDERDRASFSLRVFIGHQWQRADFARAGGSSGSAVEVSAARRDRKWAAFMIDCCGSNTRSSVAKLRMLVAAENRKDQRLESGSGAWAQEN